MNLKIKKFGVVLLLAIFVLTIAGCNKTAVNTPVSKSNSVSELESSKFITIKDMAGRTVEVPKEVEKVIGIAAGGLRFIVYLGAADRISGVENIEQMKPITRPYLMAFPELADLPLIGAAAQGDAELIAAHQPDVIIWSQPIDTGDLKPMEDLQAKTGVPVVIIRPGLTLFESREKVYESMRLAGKVLGKEDRAEELINYTDSVIADLNNRTKDIPEEGKAKVYIGGKGFRGAHGILATSGTHSPFEFINARNVAKELGTEHAFIDKEALLKWDPDIIFIESFGYELSMEDLKKPEFQSLTALKNKNIYRVLPVNQYGANFETELVAAYLIGSVLYPEKFKDVDPIKKADEIYEMFVGKPVYKEAVKVWGEFLKVE